MVPEYGYISTTPCQKTPPTIFLGLAVWEPTVPGTTPSLFRGPAELAPGAARAGMPMDSRNIFYDPLTKFENYEKKISLFPVEFSKK